MRLTVYAYRPQLTISLTGKGKISRHTDRMTGKRVAATVNTVRAGLGVPVFSVLADSGAPALRTA
jgi:hypothetical protein